MEHDVTAGTVQERVFEMDYVGSSSSHMFTSARQTGANTLMLAGDRRPSRICKNAGSYPDIGPIELDADLLSANYNALQLVV